MSGTSDTDRRDAPCGGINVDFGLTEDQQLFRETTRRFLESECPLTEVRRLAAEPSGYDSGWWRRGAELGWTSLMVAEADGGGSISSHGLLDLAIVAEEMGRMVAPGPLVPVNIVAATISSSGSIAQREELLPGLLAGTTSATWAFAERGLRWGARALTTRVRASDSGLVLSGVKSPVEAGGQAHWFLVTAVGDEGTTQVLVPADAPGVSVVELESLDLVRRMAEVHFDEVQLPRSAIVGDSTVADADAALQLQRAVVLQCAEICGAVEQVFEFTVAYLADRYSFGRPLASYQALKHRIADMKLVLEACHGITSSAAAAVAEQRADAAELSSAAKAYVGGACTELVQDCVQLHGGIGVTWEHDIHLYLRRVTVNRGMYGSPVEHRERVASLLDLVATES